MKNQDKTTFETMGSHQAEYDIIRKDLYTVLALNAIYLVLIIALYVSNQKTRFLEELGARLINF